MAKISLNSNAPKDEAVHLTFGAIDFDLKDSSAVYETDDPTLISNAAAHPWLTVKVELPAEEAQQERDLSDPQNNPSIDHLAAEASPEAIAKAEAEADRARKEAAADVQDLVEPTAPTKTETTQPTTEPEVTV